MKIFDCFMYFDEEVVLDLRLNMLNDYVDYFIIVESTFTHRGDKRKLRFNLEKFKKFEKKIVYLVYDESPSNIEEVLSNDNHDEKSRKYILNAVYRENGQRDFLIKRTETKSKAAPSSCLGKLVANGAKNIQARNNIPMTKEVMPVFPPAFTPAPDST